MKRIALLFAIAFLSACGSSTPDMPEEARSIYNKVARACPGFDKFSSSIAYDAMNTNDIVWYDGDTRTGLKSISLTIVKPIYADPRAEGNTCRFVLTQNEDRVVTMKDACAALCDGLTASLNGSNYEARIK